MDSETLEFNAITKLKSNRNDKDQPNFEFLIVFKIFMISTETELELRAYFALKSIEQFKVRIIFRSFTVDYRESTPIRKYI